MMISEDDFADTSAQYLESLMRTLKTSYSTSVPTVVAYGFLVVTIGYHMLQYFDFSVLHISELSWNMLVYLTPSSAISAFDKRVDVTTLGKAQDNFHKSSSYQHAVKSEVLRRILGLSSAVLFGKVQQTNSFPRFRGLLPGKKSKMKDEGPPGLRNRGNSCYQNSVIQGLASLRSLYDYLARPVFPEGSFLTANALRSIIAELNDPVSARPVLQTPAELKTMNSQQQQDAQEYFSEVVDEVGREISEIQNQKSNFGGLASFLIRPENIIGLLHEGISDSASTTIIDMLRSFRGLNQIGLSPIRSPLEGLLAQRVGCLRCGHSEGISLVPFNCLTVSLGKEGMYDIQTCLDEYTALETIAGVECVKCTLLQTKDQLKRLHSQIQDSTSYMNQSTPSSQALRTSFHNRLIAIEKALEVDDFSDNAILKKHHIAADRRVSVTKSRQAVIARAPKSLVIHVNRSDFDEITRVLSKNVAEVTFPRQIDLTRWCLGGQAPRQNDEESVESWCVDPSKPINFQEGEEIPVTKIDDSSMDRQQLYDLRAIITHYGQHDNGHYICYRKCGFGSRPDEGSAGEKSEPWWCLSDEKVGKVSEKTVLNQGGVFMLFYEKLELTENAIMEAPKDNDVMLSSPLLRSMTTTSETMTVAIDELKKSEGSEFDYNYDEFVKHKLDNILDEDLFMKDVVQQSVENRLSEAFEPRRIMDAAMDVTPIIFQTLLNSITLPSPLTPSAETLSAEVSFQAKSAPPETTPLEAPPETISFTERPWTPSSPLSFSSTEPSPSESLQENNFSDTAIATTIDSASKFSSLEPCATLKVDDSPQEASPVSPLHLPISTTSPRSSRRSLRRAGKATRKVSAMVRASRNTKSNKIKKNRLSAIRYYTQIYPHGDFRTEIQRQHRRYRSGHSKVVAGGV